jgi:hypothetical protein
MSVLTALAVADRSVLFQTSMDSQIRFLSKHRLKVQGKEVVQRLGDICLAISCTHLWFIHRAEPPETVIRHVHTCLVGLCI